MLTHNTLVTRANYGPKQITNCARAPDFYITSNKVYLKNRQQNILLIFGNLFRIYKLVPQNVSETKYHSI